MLKMLRAVSSINIESQAFAVVRRDVIKLFRTTAYSGITSNQTVLAGVSPSKEPVPLQSTPPPSPSTPPSQPPPRGPRRGWFTATAVALTASFGGVYLYRKLNINKEEQQLKLDSKDESGEVEGTPIPPSAESLPNHVEYLVVGGGTAAFAALRALRSVRPEARVLLVSEEIALPYMRPPLNKELWREPDLATRAADSDTLVFQQWNGKRRRLAYEPNSFYLPTEKLRDGSPGAGVARGWTVTALDVDKHEAKLSARGTTATLTYDKCLIATGARAKRCEALRAARSAGLALPLRSARDVSRLDTALQRSRSGSVVVLGGGAHACELAAALAERLRDSDKRVVLMFREATPLADELPDYLAAHLARTLQTLGVHLLPNTEVTDSRVSSEQVNLQLSKVGGEEISPESEKEGSELVASLVVECVGIEPNTELAVSSGLEVHPDLGGIVVNAEMQARTGVFAAGDAACYHEALLGRRRVARHDHAVASGRLAGANMAALEPARAYTHQPMLWTDVGPRLGYEAIGIIDSRLPTVGVFSADAVTEAAAITNTQVDAEAKQAVIEAYNQIPTVSRALSQDVNKETGSEIPSSGTLVQRSTTSSEPSSRSYERGVVFYLKDKRVVGVLLWNLFNRMHIARQVLKQGEFEDMFEVAKLFSLHEED